MRTKEFQFKKTKTVKPVTTHDAISIDLTVNEAADLHALISVAHTPNGRYLPLLAALANFTEKHGVTSDLEPCGVFRMRRAVPAQPRHRRARTGDAVRAVLRDGVYYYVFCDTGEPVVEAEVVPDGK